MKIMRSGLLAAMLAAAFFGGTSQAQSEQALESVSACAQIADPAERLACYDAAAQTLRTPVATPDQPAQPADAPQAPQSPQPPGQPVAQSPAPPAQPAAAIATPAAPPAAPAAVVSPAPPQAAEEVASPPDDYGLPQRRERNEAAYAVADFSTTPDRRLRIEMENGQVWSQVGYDRVLLPRGGDVVAEVTPGVLNSYFMSLNGGRRFRVKRDR